MLDTPSIIHSERITLSHFVSSHLTSSHLISLHLISAQLITGARATMIAMGGTMASAILLQPWLSADQQQQQHNRILSPRSRARLPAPPPLSPQLKKNLQQLKQRVGVPFDRENQQHEVR